MSPAPLLSLRSVGVDLTPGRTLVQGVDLDVMPGEIVAIVGESGSGKTVTTQAILRLLDPKQTRISGQIRYDGQDILAMPKKALRELRGHGIGMIFQDPMSSLNPLLRIGYQITEAQRCLGMPAARCKARALELMALVGLRDPDTLYHAYPHELSGGMRQRVMIAMALMGAPKLLIADEPTTALDVTVQKQVLDLIRDIRTRTGIAVLLITHDLGVVNVMAERVHVMYAGRIVETGPTADVLSRPGHPYTRALLAATPRPGARVDGVRTRLTDLSAMPQDPVALAGCVIHRRPPQGGTA